MMLNILFIFQGTMCVLCGNQFGSTKQRDGHLRLCRTRMSLICPGCKLPFDNPGELAVHRHECHSRHLIVYYACDPCDQLFFSVNDFEDHQNALRCVEECVVEPQSILKK